MQVYFNTCFGRFAWCGNNYDGRGSGFYLTDITHQKVYGKTNIQMVYIAVQLDDNLLQKTDIIEVIDENGFLAQYTYYKLKNENILYFPLKYYDQTKPQFQMTIHLRKIKTGNVQPLRRPEMETLLSKTIHIPLLKREDLNSECSICLENISDDSNLLWSACNHMFHMDCIWEYMKKNSMLQVMSKMCKLLDCGHNEKPKKLNCPICRAIISVSRY